MLEAGGRRRAQTRLVVFCRDVVPESSAVSSDAEVIEMVLPGPRHLTADHQNHPQLHTPCDRPGQPSPIWRADLVQGKLFLRMWDVQDLAGDSLNLAEEFE